MWVVADATKDGSETGTSMEQALHFKRIGLKLHDTMIYQKLNYLPQNAPDRYDQAWEYVFVLSSGRPKSATLMKKKNAKSGVSMWTGGRINADGVLHDKVFREIAADGMRHNVWPYPTGGGVRDHPAVFPLALAVDVVSTWSTPGDIILDPFAGSGTTLKAAQDLGRLWVGIEINPDYIPICEARTAQASLDLVSG